MDLNGPEPQVGWVSSDMYRMSVYAPIDDVSSPLPGNVIKYVLVV